MNHFHKIEQMNQPKSIDSRKSIGNNFFEQNLHFLKFSGFQKLHKMLSMTTLFN